MLHRPVLTCLLAAGCAPLTATPGGSTAPNDPSDLAPAGAIVGTGAWDCEGLTLPSTLIPCDLEPDPAAVAECGATGAAAFIGGNPFATVADAVALASSGDVVTVCPGTWDGTFPVREAIVLEAADPTPGTTVLDPAGVDVSAAATFRGLTLRNGRTLLDASAPGVELECLVLEGSRDSAVVAAEGLTVLRSTFRDNAAEYEGGALSAGPGLRVEDSWFEGNFADYEGGAIAAIGDATVVRSVFLDNHAGYGAGALSWGDWDPFELTVSGSLFQCNRSGYEGGAVQIGTWAADTVTLSGSTFVGNHSRYEGAAVGVGSWGAIDLRVVDSVFEGNDSREAALMIGGWLKEGAVVTLARTVFTDNVAETGGSAIGVGSRVPVADILAEELVVLRNSGGAGALGLTSTATFACTACDFGSGVDDNTPHDADTAGGAQDGLGPDFTL